MKGRIVLDIADDDGALVQIALIKSDAARSCVKATDDEQIEEVKKALAEIKAQTGRRIDVIQ
jgi:hypothetical protein